MKNIFIAFILIFSGICGGYAQSVPEYQRYVIDSQSLPLDYFNVVIRNLPDSTYLQGHVFFDGRMELNLGTIERKKILVQIQCFGYEDFTYVEDFSNPTTADTITMKEAALVIDPVVVSASAPAIRTSQGKIIVQVAGSSLQHLAEIQDILRRAPGLRVDNGGLTVFGKGTPQIFLDNRESSYEELQLLQPSQIVSIEVDRNPSARYDASYSSVVRVRTNRMRNATSGQIVNHSYFGRRYSDVAGAQLQIASSKWINYFSYQYSDQTHHDYVHDTEAIHLPGAQIADSVYSNRLYSFRQHSVLYGSALDITPRHKLSWQYAGAFRESNSRDRGQERIFQSNNVRNIDVEQISNGNRSSHSVNLGYGFTIDSVRTLEITADYARATPKNDEKVKRHYLESADEDLIVIGNRSTADVFSTKAEYGTSLWGADLFAGVRYGYIDSKTTTDYTGTRNSTSLKSSNVAAYATIGNEYERWGWEAGLRGEFMNDNVHVNGERLRDGWVNNLFPSLELYTSELSKAVDLSLSYTSRIDRPTVEQLNPAVSYVNSVVTYYGNPLLISTVNHNIEFGMTFWSNLSLIFGADYYINPIIEAGTLSENGDAINFTPVNINRSRRYLIDLTYSNQWGPFSAILNGGVEFPHTRIPYLDNTITIGNPSWYAIVNCDLKISKSTFLTCGFEYIGRSYDLMTVSEPMYNLTAGITQYLFDKRMQLSLSGYDLLRGIKDNWHDRYGYYETTQYASRDRRYLRFSVRFLFNSHKARYSERGYSEEYYRIN